MGVINVTPDSFFSGSRKNELTAFMKAAEKMLEEGADFLDIGGYSTRPGSTDISTEEESTRIVEPIAQLAKEFPEAKISIDTFRSEVAKKACDVGACIVNDISAGHLDEQMLHTVSKLKVPYIAMHMRGTPQTMMDFTDYENLLLDVSKYFSNVLRKASVLGIDDVILDPGFGFSKTLEQNYELLSGLEYLKHLDLPILVGLSRKSMIYKLLNISPNEALNGTTTLNTLALFKGASILRVHDIREAVEVVKLVSQLS